MSQSLHFPSSVKTLIFVDATPNPLSAKEKATSRIAHKRFRESSSTKPHSRQKLSIPNESIKFIRNGLKYLEQAQYKEAVESIIQGYEVYPQVEFVKFLLKELLPSSIVEANILSSLNQSLSAEENIMGCSLLKSLAHYKMYKANRARSAKEQLIQTPPQQRGAALFACLRYYFLIQIAVKKIKHTDPSALADLREAYNLYPDQLSSTLKKECPNLESLLPKLVCTDVADQEFSHLLLKTPCKSKMEIRFLLI